MQIDDTRKLTVYGEKQVAGNKYKRFKNIVTMLQDADIANISAKFEHGILFISMPKIMSKSTDKEPQRLSAVDPEKEAATKTVDRKDQEASKKVAPQEKQDDVREEAMELINKGGEDTHQRVVDNHKDEEEQGGGGDEKVDMVKSEKEEKTSENCRDGIKEGDDVGEKLRERVRSTLGWIGEKVRGGMEMQEVEGVGGRLLNVARKNKEVIAAAVVAFTFGFYVSKKLRR